jgi:hypothetical protein
MRLTTDLLHGFLVGLLADNLLSRGLLISLGVFAVVTGFQIGLDSLTIHLFDFGIA